MRIYLYGNCQSTALRKLMAEVQPGWSITNMDLTAVPGFTDDVMTRHFRSASEADIVISQTVGAYTGRTDLSTDALRNFVAPNVPFLTFPPLFFNGLHPAVDYMTGHASGFRSDYHNAHTIDMFMRAYDWSDIAAIQSSPDLYTRDFVIDGIAASIAEMKRREVSGNVTIAFSPFLQERGQAEVVMNTVNHPKRAAMAFIANSILRALSLPGECMECGEDHLPFPKIPPLPTVLRWLDLPDVAPDLVFENGVSSRRDHVLGSLRFYSQHSRDDLWNGFRRSRLASFIEAFRQSPVLASDPSDARLRLLAVSARQLIEETYRALLRRDATNSDLAFHLERLAEISVPEWIHGIVASEEYRLLQRPPQAPL